jgi:hypothetical protein
MSILEPYLLQSSVFNLLKYPTMTKKDYILTLLRKLDGIRDMATPLQTLIEHTDVDDAFIDGLAAMMMEAVHEVADANQKKKLQTSQDFLHSLQSKETEDSV